MEKRIDPIRVTGFVVVRHGEWSSRPSSVELYGPFETEALAADYGIELAVNGSNRPFHVLPMVR